MNRLEGKLIRSIFKRVQNAMNCDLFNNANKMKPLLGIGKRTDANIIANLLAQEVISINDFNRIGKEQWTSERTFVVQAMATIMIGAIAYGVKHDDMYLHKIKKLVSDEAGTKKALNLKGWVTSWEQGKKSMLFIAISTSGDGFVFDGEGRCSYFLWNFDSNAFKSVRTVL